MIRSFMVRFLFVVALALFAWIPAIDRPVAASSPRLNLKPDHGLAGKTIVASGRNFSPSTTGTAIFVEDGSTLATFQADEEGDFLVEIVIPETAPGEYEVSAEAGAEVAADTLEIEAPEEDSSSAEEEASALPAEPMPEWMRNAAPEPSDPECPSPEGRRIDVADAERLTAALEYAQPGDQIVLADGVYSGTFIAGQAGSEDARIGLCGSRDAVIDAGDFGNGYALHITGDYWTVQGITIANALKGVMLDDAEFTVLSGIEVHTIGHEAVHFRSGSSDNVIQESDIHNTGLKRGKFGEGIYLGSAVSNWEKYSGGGPDQSDRNQVLRNRIWDTTSESIDIKEGTIDGLIEGNLMDGSSLSGADSWIDVKGSGYIVRGNQGRNTSGDGYQTHVINDMEWGSDNVFDGNIAIVNGDGFGFYVHDAETSNNIVLCNNEVTEAGSGFANLECT